VADVANLGMGVMLNMLCGNKDSVAVAQAALGKTIAALSLTDDALHFTMGDGSKFRLFDDGQSCCERRYMRTDDNLADYVGATLKSMETRDGPTVEDEHGEPHDVQFLAIITDRGELVCSSHNEHNGYYGGFSIRAEAE
jgi:hypothetical protein